MNTRALRSVGLAVLLFASSALAQAERTIETTRILLGDIVDVSSQAASELDLGPAPPPGGSRMVTKDEILRELRAAGQNASGLKLPATVRVTSAARRLTPEQLEALLRPELERSVPASAELKALSVRRGAVLSPRAEIGRVEYPKLPKREGTFKSTAMAELTVDGEVVMRVPVSVTLELKPEAARSALERGAQVHLVIERGAARVSAVGIALTAADVGDVVQFRVQNTQKVLRARVESRTLARVVGN